METNGQTDGHVTFLYNAIIENSSAIAVREIQ